MASGGLLSCHSRQRERLSASMLSICSFVCLSVCRQNAKKTLFSQKLSNLDFKATVSIDDIGSRRLWHCAPYINPLIYLLTYLHRLFNEPIIGPLKSKMAEIRHFENRHDVIFFCWGWSDLDKVSQTGAEWHVDCDDMVKIESRCKIPIWRTFGRIQWHVIPEPLTTLQGAATWRIL